MKKLTAALNQTINKAIKAERIIGTSILVAQHGKIISETQAGWANREEKTRYPANFISISEHD